MFDHDVVAVGEGFAAAGLAVAGLLNASVFVVNVIEDAASLVGALNQVAGFVVGVAEVCPNAFVRINYLNTLYVANITLSSQE